jgi:hypothetical protein
MQTCFTEYRKHHDGVSMTEFREMLRNGNILYLSYQVLKIK